MVFAILLFVLGVSFAAGCEYEQLSNNHTMCFYTHPACPLLRNGLYQEDVDVILDTHNKLRSKVATGQQPGQPPAANMNQLKWDDELADIAQRLAEQCYNPHCQCSPHDDGKNRVAFGYKSVGQNIADQWRGDEEDFVIKDFVEGWFNHEVGNLIYSDIAAFPDQTSRKIGHYTQLVWAKSEAVGCGFSKYRLGKDVFTHVVCNYGPAGNWLGDKIYEEGDACSQCTNGCSQQYDGLCV